MVIKTATITSASVVASSVAGRNIAKNMTPAEVTEIGLAITTSLCISFLVCLVYIFFLENEVIKNDTSCKRRDGK